MANESAGTIYAEIKLALDTLQVDINKAGNMFKQLGSRADEQNQTINNSTQNTTKNIVKAFTNMSNTGINQFAKMASSIQKAFMALPIIGLLTMITGAISKLINGVGEYLNRTADAYAKQQKELTTLNAVVQTTGASAWTTSAQLESMSNSLSKATGYAQSDIRQMQTRILTYTNIIGDNFKRTSKTAIDMSAVMGMDLTTAAETLGKALDSPAEGLNALTRQGFRFSESMKEQIKLLTEQGKISEAQVLILNEVEKVYNGVANAQETVISKTERLKKVQEDLDAEVGKTTSGFTNFVAGLKLSWKEAQLFELRQRRLGEAAKNTENKMNEYKKSISDLRKELDEVSGSGDEARIIEIQIKIKKLEEDSNALKSDIEKAQERVDAYEMERKSIKVNRLELNRLYRERINNSNGFQKLQEQINEALKKDNDVLAAQLRTNLDFYITNDQVLQGEINKHKEIVDTLEEKLAIAKEDLRLGEQKQKQNEIEIEYQNKYKADINKIKPLEEEVAAAIKKREQAIYSAGVALSKNRITQEEYNQQVLSAYTEEANQLTTIKQKMSELTLQTVEGINKKTNAVNETNTALNTSIELEKQRKTILADDAMNAKWREYTDEIMKQKMNEKELKEFEKERAFQQLVNSQDYINATKEVKQAVVKAFDEMWDAVEKKDPWKVATEAVQKYGSQINNVLASIAELQAINTKKRIDKEIKELDRLFNYEMKQIEKRKQAKLFEKGYIEAQTEEQHKKELELAIESGDQQRIYAAHDAFERFKIEEEAAAAKEALEEQTNKKKAQLEYEAAMATWKSQILSSLAAGALAVINAIASVPYPANIAAGIITGGVATAQQAVVLANKPTLQYANGGIVPGNSFRGDNILTAQNSREMDLNLRQQKNLFDRIENNDLGGSNVTVTIPIYLDRKIIATGVVEDDINNRKYLIKQGSIV